MKKRTDESNPDWCISRTTLMNALRNDLSIMPCYFMAENKSAHTAHNE